jgi:hypothetical protein
MFHELRMYYRLGVDNDKSDRPVRWLKTWPNPRVLEIQWPNPKPSAQPRSRPYRLIQENEGRIPASWASKEHAAFEGCVAWFAAAGWPIADFDETTLATVDTRMSALLLRVTAAAAGKSGGPVRCHQTQSPAGSPFAGRSFRSAGIIF